ncbi:MAG: DUF4097 family beta strand repeat protein [Candidatus Krumholzibacteriota bacterium]|nr:DUF4097 family beta strand repeat protein [Candidatus Krumholzibacteriota bacterium]
MKVRAILSVLLLLTATGAVAADVHQRELSRDFDAGIREVQLQNLAGRVLLEGATGDRLEVRAVVNARDYRDRGAEAISQLLEVEFELSGGRLDITAVYPLDETRTFRYEPDDRRGLGSGKSQCRYMGKQVTVYRGRSRGMPLWVDFHVRVPKGTNCAVRNLAGNVRLSGLAGDTRADTGSGDVVAEGCRGALWADTGSGDVTATGGEGDLDLDTGSGDIEVADHAGEVKADTGSGDVTLERVRGSYAKADTGSGDVLVSDFEGRLEADTGSGDVNVVNARGERLEADTGSGDVRLRDVDYPDMDLDTGSGSIRVAASGDRVERWRVDTGSGDVELYLPETASFRLEADMGGGRVRCRFPNIDMRKVRKGRIRSLQVGDGHGLIRVSTANGDVEIIARED